MPEVQEKAAFMRRSFELAASMQGRVGNGALVGAVLVRRNQIFAEGVFCGPDTPHAERALLESFTSSVEASDTLYVNLEPCCPHPGKRSPPCTELLISRGIRQIVVGIQDPDRRVSGCGAAILRAAGVSVEIPFLEDEAREINRGFLSCRETGLPFLEYYSGALDFELAHRAQKFDALALSDCAVTRLLDSDLLRSVPRLILITSNWGVVAYRSSSELKLGQPLWERACGPSGDGLTQVFRELATTRARYFGLTSVLILKG